MSPTTGASRSGKRVPNLPLASSRRPTRPARSTRTRSSNASLPRGRDGSTCSVRTAGTSDALNPVSCWTSGAAWAAISHTWTARGVGVDHNAHSVGIARQRGLRAYLPDEFAESEWNRPGRFDSLLLAHVAEHLPKSEAQDLLERYLPNVKPGGKVIVIVPQQAGFRADDSHVRRVGAAELSELAEALGLRIARIYSYPFPEWVGRLFVHNETVMVCRR